jgi:hypothetical protein
VSLEAAGSATNPPFAREITWAVSNELSYRARNSSRGTRFGRVQYHVDASQQLAISATIGDRVRNEVTPVSKAVFEAVQDGHRYTTSGIRYGVECIVLSVAWVAAFALSVLLIFVSLAPLLAFTGAVLVLTPPSVANAIVDVMWWSGHGFVHETRAKWIIAGLLWTAAVLPAVLLQMAVA